MQTIQTKYILNLYGYYKLKSLILYVTIPQNQLNCYSFLHLFTIVNITYIAKGVFILRIIIKIYDIRTQRGYTLRKLEKKSGVSFSAINLIENGQRSPTLETLRLIAEALSTSVKDLFDEEE